jgi:hypothetical protein
MLVTIDVLELAGVRFKNPLSSRTKRTVIENSVGPFSAMVKNAWSYAFTPYNL